MNSPNFMTNFDPTTTETAAAMKAGAALADQSGPFAIIPDGYRLQDTEDFQDAPRRTRASVKVLTLEMLIAYVNRFKASPTCFVTKDGNVTAILDYDRPDSPSWRHHEVTFAPSVTDAWAAWTSKNGRWMPQTDFADFIEDHVEDVVEPTGADMLELARNLSMKRNVEFQSKVNLTNGDVQFNFTQETSTGSSERGTITAPETFKIGLRPYMGFDGFQMECRLRYRISDEGKLTFAFKILKLEDVKEKAAERVFDTLTSAFPNDLVLWGSAPSKP